MRKRSITVLVSFVMPSELWVWARGRCRISPPRFLAECCKRQLNQVSLVLLYFRLSAYSELCWVCLSVFSCTVLFVSISQVIGCEDRLRNDLYCVRWGVKLYSNQINVEMLWHHMHCMVTLIVAYLTREVLPIFFSVTAEFTVLEILYVYLTELEWS